MIAEKQKSKRLLRKERQRCAEIMAQQLRSVLTEDPSLAQRQFQHWEAETLKNLGLEEFA
jgi:hypothetical protein